MNILINLLKLVYKKTKKKTFHMSSIKAAVQRRVSQELGIDKSIPMVCKPNKTKKRKSEAKIIFMPQYTNIGNEEKRGKLINDLVDRYEKYLQDFKEERMFYEDLGLDPESPLTMKEFLHSIPEEVQLELNKEALDDETYKLLYEDF